MQSPSPVLSWEQQAGQSCSQGLHRHRVPAKDPWIFSFSHTLYWNEIRLCDKRTGQTTQLYTQLWLLIVTSQSGTGAKACAGIQLAFPCNKQGMSVRSKNTVKRSFLKPSSGPQIQPVVNNLSKHKHGVIREIYLQQQWALQDKRVLM
jgi:hypothetical protein